MHSEDMRMEKLCGNPDLAKEPLRADCRRNLFIEDLDRDPPAMAKVPREIYTGHSTTDDLAFDAVMVRHGTRQTGDFISRAAC